jgi:hypothetical protein
MSAPDLSPEAWARRGQWLAEHLSERSTPDGRTVLELVEEPIWVRADATWDEYITAIDLAIERDESGVMEGAE